MVSHGLRKRAHMQEALRRQWLNLRLAHRDNINGIAHGVKNFQGVTGFLVCTSWMVFDNGGYISSPKTMLGEAGFERYSAEHFVFHVLSG
jgi:hypothetical protein